MNRSNPSIKRILADVRELEKHPSSRYYAEPMEDNMFEWHFTIRGPKDSDFEGGYYHGRILLPSEYPFKPPNIIFLTKNGRFETGTKICLSISAYHEECWQPAWGIRTMLEAIISFFPTPGGGAIGALDWSKSERQRLAKLSESYTCPHCCANNEPICKLIKHVDVDGESNAEDREEIEKQIKQLSMAAAPPSPAVSTNPKSENNDIRANSINNNSDVAKDAESAGLKNKEGEGMVVLPTQEILETDDGAPVKTATAAVSIATDSTVGIVVENKNTPAIPVNSTPLKNNATESEKKGTTDLTVKSKSMNQKNVKKEGGDLIDNLFIVAMTLVALLIAYLVGKKMLRSV